MTNIKPTLIFLDTEFTGIDRPMGDIDLVSVGMCADGFPDLYLELNDFDLKKCNRFVHDRVLPYLENTEAVLCSKQQARDRINQWLEKMGPTKLVCTSHYDFNLLTVLMVDEWPKSLTVSYINAKFVFDYSQVNDVMNDYFKNGGQEHHALHDARALMLGYMKYSEQFGVQKSLGDLINSYKQENSKPRPKQEKS